ncbi:MAG: hypothetical protein AAGD09_09070 [Cyanobacteria bacterium P01_F01_bin.56]
MLSLAVAIRLKSGSANTQVSQEAIKVLLFCRQGALSREADYKIQDD